MNLARIFACALLPFTAVALLSACAAPRKAAKSDERLIKENIPRTPEWKVDNKPVIIEPAPPPAFSSLTEEIVPLKTKMVNIVVRNGALGDVLHVLAEASGLNLLIDRDVNVDQRVTLSLKNALAEDALKTIFSNLDYFYSIDNNVLKVEAMGTRIFELGHPALVNSYSMDVGGDILSASGANGLKGNITSGNKADIKAYDFWSSLESSLEHIMGKQEAPAVRARSAKTKAQNKDEAAGAAVDEGAGSELEGATPGRGQQQTITVNRLTGTIMVTASRRNMDKVERYLENVRKVLGRQVMIEARIIEVQLSEALQYGVDWSFLEKNAAGALGGGFGGLNLATTSFNDATAAAAATNKFQLGVTRANFQALLTALQTQGNIKVLSNPKISVMNGHASILTVGTNTSFISKVTTTTTATAAGNSISFVPETTSILSGLIIGIIPYISENGEISLNITPITSDLINLTDKTFGSAGNQLTITIPTVALREMTTTVKMWDGQTAIIGGLISKNETQNEEKVPVLGSLPYLGKLFTRVNNTSTKTELVLLLRPSIVDNQ